METSSEKNIDKASLEAIPHTTGVYVFHDKTGLVLYVGKAIDLSRRVKQYFSSDDAIGIKTAPLVSQIYDIQTIPTANEFDALLLEAKLIRTYKPKYNSIAKDDKSPLYICLTLSEELPHLLYLRGRQVSTYQKKRNDAIFGPFQSGRLARTLAQRLRHSIPFCTQRTRTGKPCFYTHLGLCRPCPSTIAKLAQSQLRAELVKQYRHHIFQLRNILSGKTTRVLRAMEGEMKTLARHNKFEEAQNVKHQFDALVSLYSRHFDVSVYTEEDTALPKIADEQIVSLVAILQPYFPPLNKLARIECIDISNISGLWATGSLVVLTDGIIDTSQYRRFRIKGKHTADDVAMIEEVLRRRLAHRQWPYPDLLVVDGGKGQVNRAQQIMRELGLTIPIIGLAKRMEEIIVKGESGFKTVRLPFTHPGLHLLERIRDEAHRFARVYHRSLRRSIGRAV